jgi:F420-dependent oxidoreductase-like protein
MRFAFKTSPQNTTWADMLRFWREGDSIELFESAWLFDHFYPIAQPGRPTADDGPCLEGWTTLAALADATTRLRLGTLVTGVPYRHPAVLANMAATVDIISGGRLELGLGAGWNQLEAGAYGIELGTPRERSDRFEEACEVIISLLSRPSTDFAGKYFQLEQAHCEPKSVQRPHPPIVIGGNGEARTLRTAARFAGHWNYIGLPPAGFARKRDILWEHCRAIGRDPREITLSSQVWLASGSAADLDSVARTVDALVGEGVDLMIVYMLPPLDPGVLEPLANVLSARFG